MSSDDDKDERSRLRECQGRRPPLSHYSRSPSPISFIPTRSASSVSRSMAAALPHSSFSLSFLRLFYRLVFGECLSSSSPIIAMDTFISVWTHDFWPSSDPSSFTPFPCHELIIRPVVYRWTILYLRTSSHSIEYQRPTFTMGGHICGQSMCHVRTVSSSMSGPSSPTDYR